MRLVVHSVRAEGHWRGGQFWTPTPRTVEADAALAATLRGSSLLVVTEVRPAAAPVAPTDAQSEELKASPPPAKETMAPGAGKKS